jgi:SGNH domain (fused to AT3 domains)
MTAVGIPRSRSLARPKIHYHKALLKLYNPLPFKVLKSSSETLDQTVPSGGSVPSRNGSINLQTETFDAIVVGDSFAGALEWIVKNNPTMQFLIFAQYSCSPLFNRASLDVRTAGHGDNSCAKTKRMQMLDLSRRAQVKRIIISGNWPSYRHVFLGYFVKNGTETKIETSLLETTDVLLKTGRSVIVVGEVPGAGT